ncbi:hypothetical protein ACFWC9_13305 [Streptomyces goshikiensis]|uniref:hypothetical protein n=1 Tax=Streptomyces goshikiensis TaxID=1942 RepID=UPI0036BF8829
MIVSSLDTTSQEYAFGQVAGVVCVAAVAIVLLWRQTRSWRSPATPAAGDPAQTLREQRKRHLLTIGLSVLIAVGAGTQAAVSYRPEPRASEIAAAGPAAQGADSDADVEAAAAGVPRSVVLPDSFGGFRLMTGEAAAAAETAVLARRKMPEGMKTGYYDQNGDGDTDLFTFVRSTESDPAMRAEKAAKSISQEFRDFFTGAKSHDVTAFDAGSHGGGLSCGLTQGPAGDQAVCAWSDATTFGAVRLIHETNLAKAAQTTLALRNTATH